ncbi:ATP-dependent helicase [Cellulomonas timonensis]|uniref:ATP-dependent helicase n=1 Tax=Cellulomonas timonensis TaxID=1689271 RepID=UPI0028FCCAFD|nr:ATP-dependent DNA helicase [Cellulomonas timonensis]
MNHRPASTMLRLVRPVLAEAEASGGPRLDADQQAVVDTVAAGQAPALLVLGAPGTGKTTVAVEAVVAAMAAGGLAPEDVLVIAASRRAAAELRDRLSARLRLTSGQAMVRTAPAAAFAVLRARAALLGDPPPTLISGPEQDLLLAELLAGHAEGEGAHLEWPAAVPAEALGLRAFRDELRDLLMRAAERGLTPVDLAELGARHDRPAWVAAAGLYQEYLDVTLLRAGTPDMGARHDPAVVVDEAAEALLAWDEEVAAAPRPRWRLVVVDDHQESTAATARLLRVLADDGARLLLPADPDVAVQGLRGASPALVGRATVDGDGLGELGAQRLVLGTVWRHGARLRQAASEVASRVGALGAVAHRRAVAVEGAEAGTARGAILPSAAQEAAYVAHALRSAHLEHGVPWERMAVIARSGSQVTALRRALAGAAVPVAVLGSDVPLREEPAVRPLLEAVRCVLPAPDGTAAPLDPEVAARLLCSPLGGLDAVGLRRVRRALRAEEIDGGGGRSSDALLAEVLADPAHASALPTTVRRPVLRLAEVLAAGRAAALAPTADPQTVLWALWHATGLSEAWRRSALAGGPGSARADRDLDAVLALFRAAETFVDRLPQAPPGAFVDWVLSQDLPADTIAARAHRDAVAVLTPPGAAGREWDVVVVAGVQDGVWPDLRLRDSLLGAQTLVEILAGREPDAGQLGAGARAAVLADELRSFAVSVSRARRALLVTAVADADTQPSPFVELIEPCEADVDPRKVMSPAPLDLRGLVAQLRSHLEATAVGGRPDAGAAALLARLAREGVEGADPAQWHGLAEPSSDAVLWAEGEKVPVSPSKVETASTCALRWALEAAGGTAAESSGQSLGTLVHAIAQTYPHGSHDELLAELDRRWPELGLGDGWPALVQRRRAEGMVRRLAQYVRSAGEPLLVEGRFELELDRAVVRGSVDRVELASGGASPDDPPLVRVSDLKTGRSAPSVAKATENAQLGAYQLAVDEGAFEGLPPGARSAGAQLVFVSDVGKGPTLRVQPPLEREDDGSTWARTLIEDVAGQMAGSTFTASPNDLCSRCPVRRSCPAQDEGAQVVE